MPHNQPACLLPACGWPPQQPPGCQLRAACPRGLINFQAAWPLDPPTAPAAAEAPPVACCPLPGSCRCCLRRCSVLAAKRRSARLPSCLLAAAGCMPPSCRCRSPCSMSAPLRSLPTCSSLPTKLQPPCRRRAPSCGTRAWSGHRSRTACGRNAACLRARRRRRHERRRRQAGMCGALRAAPDRPRLPRRELHPLHLLPSSCTRSWQRGGGGAPCA